MRFEESFDFDCGATTLLTMFGNGDYYRAKYRRMGTPEPEVVDTQTGDGQFVISMRHSLDTSAFALPALARKKLGDRVELTQTDSWDLARRSGRTTIRTDSVPVQAHIDQRLVEQESGARLILAFDVRANLPLFGGKVEQAVADGLAQRMREELQTTARMAPDYM